MFREMNAAFRGTNRRSKEKDQPTIRSCCDRMHQLTGELKAVEWPLVKELHPLISDYALGHSLVRPLVGEWKRVYEYPHITELATFDALKEALASKKMTMTVTDWKWFHIKDEKVHAVIYYDLDAQQTVASVKSGVMTGGTMLLLQTANNRSQYNGQLRGVDVENRSLCLVNLDPESQVRIALFLLQHGSPQVRQSICPVYADALRYWED